MKEKYILNPSSALILHTGLILLCLVCLGVMIHVSTLTVQGTVRADYLFSLAEHIVMSLFLVIAGSLLFDIHIKRKK